MVLLLYIFSCSNTHELTHTPSLALALALTTGTRHGPWPLNDTHFFSSIDRLGVGESLRSREERRAVVK